MSDMQKLGSLNIFDSDEIIAIGDIHGELDKLERLIAKIWKFLDNPKCHLVFCGDYFDRGPNSPGVFHYLVGLKKQKPSQVFFVVGNHEIMLWQTLVEKKTHWLRWTQSTLDQMVNYWFIDNQNKKDYLDNDFNLITSWNWKDSKDLEIVEKICKEKGFLDFLQDLLPYYENSEVICTHAPIDKFAVESFFKNSDVASDLLDSIDINWKFIEEASPQLVIPQIDKFLICGHQASRDLNSTNYNSPRIFNKRAFIDTGCGLSKNRPLTAFKYPNRKSFQEF